MSVLILPGYDVFLRELKERIRAAQTRAGLAVNRELVLLYYDIGRDILTRQQTEGWGAKVIDRLARDLKASFPEMQGLSPRNLKYMRSFAEAWPDAPIVQQPVAQIPWGIRSESFPCRIVPQTPSVLGQGGEEGGDGAIIERR